MSLLDVRNLTVTYEDLRVVDDVSFCVEEGEVLMIVGPNGAGKSTLVNAIMQGAPYSGEVRFDGVDVRAFKPAERARKIGMLMQNHQVGYAFTVEEVVSLGRYAHTRGLFVSPARVTTSPARVTTSPARVTTSPACVTTSPTHVTTSLARSPARGLFASHTDENAEQIAKAISRCGLESMLNQSVLTLSGGELQRTFLAQVFAQNPQLLILDEPTNHLDLVYQKRILELIDTWLKTSGKAVLAVVHDLSLARAFASRVMLMNKGRIIALDKPEVALSNDRLQEVYGMDVREWMQGLLSYWA